MMTSVSHPDPTGQHAGSPRSAASGSSPLWVPGRIGTRALPSRFVLTGHGTGMVAEGRPTEQMVDYYAERARGGVALIMLGTQQVHPSSPGLGHLLVNYDDDAIAGLRRVATAVHAHGALVFGYIGHFGAQAPGAVEAPWTASTFYDESQGRTTHGMSVEEIDAIVAAHADAAARNVAAGLDGIEVHGGHGLLLHQFLSPWTNQRSDEYGGSLDKRLRFPCEVVAAVRRRIGPDVPLGMRLSVDESVPGGLDVSDMMVIVPRLVAAGQLDFVDLTAGNDRDRVSNMLHHPAMDMAVAPYADSARRIRATISVPVIHGTRIESQRTAEALLQSGAADFAGMCRALIADPHLPNKIKAGHAGLANPCVACEQACIGRLHRGAHISCVGNPITGRETAWREIGIADEPQRVVVVGAGPAGMEAAWVAAQRGHRVTLLEREPAVGGLLRFASRAPGRSEWRKLIVHKAAQMAARDVDLRLSFDADVEAILAFAPDVVIMAVGGEPRRGAVDSLPGSEASNVMSHIDMLVALAEPDGGAALSAQAPPISEGASSGASGGADGGADGKALIDEGGAGTGRRVLVIDRNHHQQGVTTAFAMAEQGYAVTIVTAAMRVGMRLDHANFTRQQQQLKQRGIVQVSDVEALEIRGDRLIGRDVFSRETVELAGFDRFITVAPRIPRSELAEALVARVAARAAETGAALPLRVHSIGDCVAPRDVEAAIFEGHRVAREI